MLSDLEKAVKHFDAVAASIMDFPLELIQPSTAARGAANVQGNIRYLNEVVKSALRTYSVTIKRAFIQAYGDIIQKGLNEFTSLRRRIFKDDPKTLLIMYAENEIDIEMQYTSMMSVDELTKMYQLGIIDKKTFAELTFSQYALPQTQISLVDPPEIELLRKKHKITHTEKRTPKEGNAIEKEPKKKEPRGKEDALAKADKEILKK